MKTRTIAGLCLALSTASVRGDEQCSQPPIIITTNITVGDPSAPPFGPYVALVRPGEPNPGYGFSVPWGGGTFELSASYNGAYTAWAGSGGYFEREAGSVTCTQTTTGDCTITSCGGNVSAALFSVTGKFHGTLTLMPKDTAPPPLGSVVTITEPGHQNGGVSADATGHFQTGTYPVISPGGGQSGSRTLGWYYIDPLETVFATTHSGQNVEVNVVGHLPYVEKPCDPCEKKKRGGSAPEAGKSIPRPVGVTTGEMYLDQTDAAVGDIVFSRSYSTARLTSSRFGVFGAGWNAAAESRLTFPETGVITFRESSGRSSYYWDANSDGTFEQTFPVSAENWIQAISGGYLRHSREGAVESYGSDGKMLSMTDASGVATTYTYTAGKLASITRLGRTLGLQYTGALLTSITGPGNLTLATYGYGPTNTLQSVTYPDGAGFTFGYDSQNRLTTMFDHEGRRVEAHEYDTEGRATTSEIANGQEKYTLSYAPGITTVTDARGQISTYEYEPVRGVRQVTRITGPCVSCGGGGGDLQEWTYDGRGNILTYKNALGKIWTYTYSAFDEMLSETDPLNQTTTYTYDSQGRMLTRTGPDGAVTTYVQSNSGPTSITSSVTSTTSRTTQIAYHAPTGRPQTITDPRGKVTTMAYSAGTGDLTSVTDPLSHATVFGYDAMGRRTTVTDALGHVTTTAYDAQGRVLSVTNHDATKTEFTYDDGGRRSEVKDPLGRRTRYAYDLYARLSAVVDPMNGTTRYGYDTMGNLTSLSDAKDHKTQFEYDGHNRVKKTIYPGGAFETFTYDTAGRLSTMVDRKGTTTTYSYDDLNRLTGKTFSDGTPGFSYTNDVVGRMLTAANGTDTLTWTYNLAGELLSEQSVKNSSTVAYQYDNGGNRIEVKLDGTVFVTYAYDDASRLTTITRNDSNFTFGYDNANRRTSMSYPNGINTAYTYDNLNRLTNLAATKTSTSTSITNFGYQYDAAGNRTQKSTLDYTEDYGYDPLYRLTRTDRTNPGATPPNQWTWNYDAVGNRTSAQKDSEATTSSYNEKNQLTGATGGGKMLWRGTLDEPGIATFSAPTINGQPARMLAGNVFEATLDLPAGANTVTIQAQDGSGNVATKAYSVNVLGVPSSYTYDANGNLSAKTEGADSWTYTWNALNQLTAVTKNAANQASYSYDPLGRRVEKVAGATTTAWAYDDEDILRQNATTAAVTTTTRFVHGFGIDEPLAMEDATTNAVTYLHADVLGSITRHTNAAAVVTDTIAYDAWGNIQVGAPAPYGFTGREWDATLNLWYYRSRYYSATGGRFVSEDPIGASGGLNIYDYVGGNPTNYSDAFGLFSPDVNPNPVTIPLPVDELRKICPPGHKVQGCGNWKKRSVGCRGCTDSCPYSMNLVVVAQDYTMYVATNGDRSQDFIERHERGHLQIDMDALNKTIEEFRSRKNTFPTKEACARECLAVNQWVTKNHGQGPGTPNWWHDKLTFFQ